MKDTSKRTIDPSFVQEVVAAMYEAASGMRSWHESCSAMCEAFDLWSMQLLGVFKDTGAMAFSFEGGRIAPQAALRYVTDYHQINPRLALSRFLQGSNWVHDHEHLDEAFVAKDRFFQEFLLPYGGRWMSVTTLIDDPSVVVYLCLHRGVDSTPLQEAQIAEVDAIRIHLARALRIHLYRQTTKPVSIAGHAMLELLPYGVLVVDETRWVTYRNTAARALLEVGEVLMDRGGYLDCTGAQGSRDLAAAIHSLGLTGSLVADGGCDRALFRLPGAHAQTEFIVFAIAVRPDKTMHLFGESPCAILIVHPIEASASMDPLVVGFAFSLTPAEAQVAVALAQGDSPETVAQLRGVSLSTIRAQLRTVYEKMNVRRQSELVRKVLEMPRLQLNLQQQASRVLNPPSGPSRRRALEG